MHDNTLTFDDVGFPYELITEIEDDDDGCGSPSKSGNSMTGYRGKRSVCIGVRCTLSDKELRELVEASMYDQNESRLNEEAAGR